MLLGISLGLYNISLLLEIIIVFIIGFPVLLFILWYLDTRCANINLSKKKRITISILASILVAIWIYTDQYHYDIAFDRATETSNLSLPFYIVTSLDFPENNNMADDFGVNKTLKLLYSPSSKDIEQLERLCTEDERWTKKGNSDLFHEDIYEEELRLTVEVSGKTVHTELIRW